MSLLSLYHSKRVVFRPNEGMRAAMAAAEVGDDVFRDDPTVLELGE